MQNDLCSCSLLALSHVFADLGRSRKGFINYRDSNLTKILQRDLMSNCNVSIICCITPSGLCTEQTRKTLEFGKCAFGVKYRPKQKNRVHNGSIVLKTLSELESLKGNAYAPDYKLKETQNRLQYIESSIFNFSCQDEKEENVTEVQYDTVSEIQSIDDDISFSSGCPVISKTNNHQVHISDSDSFSKAQQKFSEMEVQWSAMKSNVLIDNTCCNTVPMEIEFLDGCSEMKTKLVKQSDVAEERGHDGTGTDDEKNANNISSEEIDQQDDVLCNGSQNFTDNCDVLLSYSMDSFSVSSDGTTQSKKQEKVCLRPTSESSKILHLSSPSPISTDIEN
jgi:Kinesin-like protein